MTKESPASLTPEERAHTLDAAQQGLTLIGEIKSQVWGIHDGGTYGLVLDALSAAEARGRERGIEEAAHRLEYSHPRIARVLRALLSAEPKATPPSTSEQREDRQTDRQEMATSPLEKIGTP